MTRSDFCAVYRAQFSEMLRKIMAALAYFDEVLLNGGFGLVIGTGVFEGPIWTLRFYNQICHSQTYSMHDQIVLYRQKSFEEINT